ncbi:MAG: hypothetical protein QOJ64_2146 [Acidobacteriota bacterium]|jgi:hypothetical protein|nr:hypothetical protein [Acidobacteriota bacterium]
MDWKSGDIMFLEGNSFRSFVVSILQFGRTDYSHVGLVVVQDGTPFVIHADPKCGRVVKERWDAVLSPDRASGAAVFRVIGASPSSVADACRLAEQYCSNAVPFDDEFDLTTDKKLYCTELVWRVYLSVGFDLRIKPDSVGHKYLLPSELIRTKVIRDIASF